MRQRESNSSRKREFVRCNGWGNKWFFNSVRDAVRRRQRQRQRQGRSSASTKVRNSVESEKEASKINNGEQQSTGSKVGDREDNDVYMILPTRDYLFRHDQGSFWVCHYLSYQLQESTSHQSHSHQPRPCFIFFEK